MRNKNEVIPNLSEGNEPLYRHGNETIEGAINPGSPRYTRGLFKAKLWFVIMAASISVAAPPRSRKVVVFVVAVETSSSCLSVESRRDGVGNAEIGLKDAEVA